METPTSFDEFFTASSLSVDDASPPLSPLGSHPFTFHQRRHSGSLLTESALQRLESLSELQDSRNSFHAGDLHETMLLGERIRAREARDDMAALIDFLRNHPPPADNFMSAPQDDDNDGRGRWSKIRKIGRRSRSLPKQQNMQLPDSAVAGVTTGGHRHIAISIPLKATPYGEGMRSQYPVFGHKPLMEPRIEESIRTYRNERGVVTIMRPVTEVYETSHDGASKAAKLHSAHTNSKGLKPPPLPPHKPTGRPSGQPHDDTDILSTDSDTPILNGSSAPWHSSGAPARGEGPTHHANQHSSTFARSLHSTRSSSTARQHSMNQHQSIDGLLSSSNGALHAPTCSRARHNSTSISPSRRAPSTCNDYSDDSGKDSCLSKTGSFRSTGCPCLDRECRSRQSETDDYRPQTSCSMRSRRDIVRDKKRRDMEAAKCKTKSKATPSLTLTMSGLMVVMDVEPCSADEGDVPTSGQERAPSTESQSRRSKSPALLAAGNDSSIPTPPISSQGSPPPRRNVTDRTSLTRRREWRAMRDQERRAREAKALTRAKTQQQASGRATYENNSATHADKDMLRVYEAYREDRFRDMERRLRRMERHGDVWLQTLLPALLNVNKTMALRDQQPLQDSKNWAAEENSTPGADRRSEDIDKSRLNQQSLSSRARALEKLSKENSKQEEETYSDTMSRSDDASGMSAVEPLMRELAMESSCQPGKSLSPVITNGAQVHKVRVGT